jgi:hypothetical protein
LPTGTTDSTRRRPNLDRTADTTDDRDDRDDSTGECTNTIDHLRESAGEIERRVAPGRVRKVVARSYCIVTRGSVGVTVVIATSSPSTVEAYKSTHDGVADRDRYSLGVAIFEGGHRGAVMPSVKISRSSPNVCLSSASRCRKD